MTLAEIQAEFLRLTAAEGADAERLLAPVTRGASTGRRLQLYREAIFMKAAQGLGLLYPKTAALVGQREFLLRIEPYVEGPVHGSQTREGLVAGLPEFLRSQRSGDRPDLADLAALERARDLVSKEPGVEPIGMERLAAFPNLAHTNLRFIPALQLVPLECDVFELWTAIDRGTPPPLPCTTPSTVLVWRSGFSVAHSALGAAEAQALQRALEGASLLEVCACFLAEQDPAASAHATLHDWFAEGLVAAVSCHARFGGEDVENPRPS